MAQTCSAEQLPLLKVLLHAAKYPHLAVNGLLLGSMSTGSSAVTVTDVVPLFHNSLALAAPTEIALGQVETYTQAEPGRPKIVGYYHADARFQSADIGPLSRRLADRIVEKYPHAVVIVLDNKKLALFMQQGSSEQSGHPFELFSREGTRGWKREPEKQLAISGGASSLRETYSSMCLQHAHRKFSDFDDHLDDVSKDYLNPELASMGKLQLPGQLR